MGQFAIPIALALASTGVGAYNTSRTARKRDAANAEGIRRQGEIQRLANLRTDETLSFFEDSGPEDIRANLSDRFRTQLRLKQNQGLAGFDTAGESSEAFQEAARKSKGGVVDRADILQALFARIDAPEEQRLEEGFERSELGSDLGVFRRNSQVEDFLTKLRVSGIRRSPWLDIASAGLSGAGIGIAAGTGLKKYFTPASTGATIAGSGGQSPQMFFDPKFASLFRQSRAKTTPGRIFGR